MRDDERGFDPAHCDEPAKGHFGLEGIRERVKRLNGTFAIASPPNAGTRVEVILNQIHPAEVEGNVL